MNFNIIIAVWGPTYVASLCDITLPSLVPGHDIFRASEDRWTFVISTRRQDEPTIRDCLSRLFPSVDVVVHHIEPETFDNHYLAMASAHHLSAKLAIVDGARALIVPPDAVFSADALATVATFAKAGKRALMVCGPRLKESTAFDAIKAALARTAQIPPRALVALALEHLHPEMRRYFWTSENFSTVPTACYWDAPEGWLARSFHLHPLMIDFSTDAATAVLERDTIDGEFIGATIGIWDDIHVIQDSDDLVLFTLTPDEVFYSADSSEAASIERLRRMAYRPGLVNPLHRWLFTKAVKIHSGDLDRRWDVLEEETGRMAFEILSIEPPAEAAAVVSEPDPGPQAPAASRLQNAGALLTKVASQLKKLTRSSGAAR